MRSLFKKEWLSVKSSIMPTLIIGTIITVIVYLGLYPISNHPLKDIFLNLYIFMFMFYFIYLIYFTSLYQDFTTYIQRALFSLPIKRNQYILGKYILFILEYIFMILYLIFVIFILSLITKTSFILSSAILSASFLYSTIFIAAFMLSTLILPYGSSKSLLLILTLLFYISPMMFMCEKLKKYILLMFNPENNSITIYTLLLGLIVFIASYILSLKLIKNKDF